MSSIFCTSETESSDLLLSRKFFITTMNDLHISDSSSFMLVIKFWSFISFQISGLSNILFLSFSLITSGNALHMYSKHAPSLSSTLTNCFISPKFNRVVGKWSYHKVLLVYTIHCFYLLSFVDMVTNLFWLSVHVLTNYSITTESMDALYSQSVAPTKS